MKEAIADTISLRGAGIVSILQPKKGHRFTLDSLLLADFCRVKPRYNVLEPGAGTGIISILLARKFAHIKITAVEIQSTMAELCRLNITQNGLTDRITLVEQPITNLRNFFHPSSFDLIVANPPYFRTGAGKQSPSPERFFSRHDRFASLDVWLDLRFFLKNNGRFVLVFSADRFADAITSLRVRGLEPKCIRFVHSRQEKSAYLVLIEAVKAAGTGLAVLPPLIIHACGQNYSEEMKELYGL